MSLDVDYTGIKDYKSLCYVKHDDGGFSLNPITEIIAIGTYPAGIHEITEKNVGECFARFTMMQALGGRDGEIGQGWVSTFIDGEYDSSRYLTKDELRAHIGLRTNVTAMSRHAFLTSQVKRGMDDIVRSFNRKEG